MNPSRKCYKGSKVLAITLYPHIKGTPGLPPFDRALKILSFKSINVNLLGSIERARKCG